MFDHLYLRDLIPWAIAAVVVASGLALFPASVLRTRLIWAWSLFPLLIVAAGFLLFPGAWFLLLFLLVVMLVPWVALTLLGYNLVMLFRNKEPDG